MRGRGRLLATRRQALAGLGLLGAGGAAGAVGRPESPGSALPAADRLLRDLIRMRTAPDGAPVIWVYSGVLVLKPDGEVARPVARIEGVSRTQAAPRQDGSWSWTLDEAGYYCTLDSGEVAETLANPFTGSAVRPRHYRSAQHLLFTPQGILPAQPLPPGVEFRGEVTRLAAVAGTVSLTEDLYVRMPAQPASDARPARPLRLAASLATFTTQARSLAQPGGRWIDCQFHYTTLNTFVDWLGMADRGGVQDMRLVGVKCRRDDRHALPAWLRARVATDHPDLL